MSAILNPTPRPSQAPPPAPVPVQPGKPGRSPFLWGLLALILVAVGGWIAYRQLRPNAQQQAATAALYATPTMKVDVGNLKQVVRVAGETGAVRFANVTAPNLTGPDSGRDLVLMKLAESGDYVKAGQLIADIDAQALKDHVEDVNSTVQQAAADVVKREAEQKIEAENLAQTIRQAKAEWEKLKLESQAAEVKTEVDRQLLKLGVEEGEAQFKELQQDLNTYNDLRKAEKRILELTMLRHEKHRDRHASDYEKFKVMAPMSGMLVRLQIRRGMELAQVRQGDEVRPRQTFAKVVDTSEMQLDAFVNQVQSSEIKIGQKARVGLDAFPGLVFEGEVYSLGALAAAGSMQNDFIRRVPVRIRILGQHQRLIPSMSGWADIEVKSAGSEQVLLPLQALFQDGDTQYVYVKKNGRFEKRTVETGLANYTHATVISGLSKGEEVALTKPASIS